MSKRKSLSQRGIPNKKKKTVVDEQSVRNSQNVESGDNFIVQIREKFEEELKCNICTEIFIRPTVLNCTHMFCEYCITKWKKQQERCPICRDRIESQIRVLALDVFIEKALEVLTPEETRARAAMISQRERKNDEAEDDTDSEEESTLMEDSSDEDFSPDENPDDFLLSSDSNSDDTSEDSSEESLDRSETDSDPDWDSNIESDFDRPEIDSDPDWNSNMESDFEYEL